MLHMEFNFVCYLGYKKDNDMWRQVVTPFYEWRKYLHFLRDSESEEYRMPIRYKSIVIKNFPSWQIWGRF